MMNSMIVIVLGGGIGGVVTATRLRKQLPRSHRIILIERETKYVFSPSLPWLMTGTRKRKDISRPRTKLASLGVEIIKGDIQSINAEQRTVQVNGQTLTGDYLIIALGAKMAAETIPSLTEACHTFYTLEGAEQLN